MLRAFSRPHSIAFLIACVLFPTTLFAHESYTIRITDGGFEPTELEIHEGDTVTFINEGNDPHWPASDLHPTHTRYPGSDIRDCGKTVEIFDACRGLQTGEAFSFTFTVAGSWDFHDHLYPMFDGTIIVSGEENAATADEPPPPALSLVKRFSAFVLSHVYSLVPSWGEQRLASLDLMEIALDDRELEYWMRVFGYKHTLDELVRDAPPIAYSGDLSTVNDAKCHTEAHFLGRVAYKIGALSLNDESNMDTRCQFGFYHGVIESSLGDLGDDQIIEELAMQCKNSEKTAMERFFCQHIIGHGIVLNEQYDLPAAITKCYDVLDTSIERKICYHGAFMENLFAAIQIASGGHETEWADRSRPDFPCTSSELPDYPDVLEQCYFNQSILWAEDPIENFDEKKAFEGCERAPQNLRNMCFGGIGFNMVLLTVSLNSDDVIEKCTGAPTTLDRDSCLIGALFLKNSSVWSSYGFRNEAFCNALGIPNLSQCNIRVGKTLSWLFQPV